MDQMEVKVRGRVKEQGWLYLHSVFQGAEVCLPLPVTYSWIATPSHIISQRLEHMELKSLCLQF